MPASINIDFNTIPSNTAFSEDEITRLSDRAVEVATAFARKLEKLQQTFNDARNNYTQDADRIIADASPDNRAAASNFAKAQAANKIGELRRNLVASSDKERSELLRTLQGYADQARQILAISKNSTMLLSRTALGEPRRSNYMQQLEGAGPLELEAAARQAVMSNDLVLAAAVATVIDRRPKDRKPFPVMSFADRMVGRTWKRINTKLEGIELAAKSALAANREFVRGKADPLMNVSIALSEKALKEAQAEET